MKRILPFVFSLFATITFAQKTEYDTYQKEAYQIENAKFIRTQGTVRNAEEARLFLFDLLNIQATYNLKLLSEIESPYQKHYTFIQTYDGLEVYQALVKVNTDKKGNITTIFSSFQEVNSISSSELPVEIKAALNIPVNSTTHSIKSVWAKKNNTFYPVSLINYTDEIGYNYDRLLNANNHPLYTFERSSHYSDQDSIAKGYVFYPDPLTTASTTYGGSFIDNNDNTNPSIDDERREVEITVNYNVNDQTFYLENDFVKIVDISPPSVQPATSSTPAFYYDRSESGFENVNVVYHITEQQRYLQSLGFMDLVNYKIDVDCHALSGSDNSLFNFNSNPPSILFGEGGVDDAEDADVIIHEYSHAIAYSAAPNTNIGGERTALDEAIGDYMAASYSRLSSYWADCCVYNWDGHNEYWNGRRVTSTAMYPTDLENNLYKDAPIWSSALMRIERNIGRDSTNMVLLSAIYNFSSNMTMHQAALLVLEQDSLIFNEKYYAPICYTFLDKGLVSSCKVSRPANLVGVEDLNLYNLQILNSANFAQGIGNIEILADKDFEIQVYDLEGHLVSTINSVNQSVTLYSNKFNSGVYIGKITLENEVKTIKISKY